MFRGFRCLPFALTDQLCHGRCGRGLNLIWIKMCSHTYLRHWPWNVLPPVNALFHGVWTWFCKTHKTIFNDLLLLKKMAFLLAIAMGACISGVEALKRGDEYLLLRGDCAIFSFGDFLAKNERPLSRRDPVTIQSLPSNKKLCPVATLRQYLQRTSHVTSGPLFINTRTNAPLKIR